jgi:hypothetical protein
MKTTSFKFNGLEIKCCREHLGLSRRVVKKLTKTKKIPGVLPRSSFLEVG